MYLVRERGKNKGNELSLAAKHKIGIENAVKSRVRDFLKKVYSLSV